jgi:hypothetical protein
LPFTAVVATAPYDVSRVFGLQCPGALAVTVGPTSSFVVFPCKCHRLRFLCVVVFAVPTVGIGVMSLAIFIGMASQKLEAERRAPDSAEPQANRRPPRKSEILGIVATRYVATT